MKQLVFAGWLFQHVIATCGVGLLPPLRLPFVKKPQQMAGTYGSLFAFLLIVPALLWAQSSGPVARYVVYGVIVLIVYWLGIVSIPGAEKSIDWEGKTHTHDQNPIVIDKVYGMFITSAPLLSYEAWHQWPILLFAALLLFRIFDTKKPWPIPLFERIQNAHGVMLDDGIAGIYAAIGVVIVHLALGFF